MICHDLQSFIGLLKKERQLIEISTPVDPYLEAAEIHRRVISEGGPALLFKSIKGAEFPLVTNLFGTQKRIELAFGPRPEKFISEIAALPHELLPPTLSKLWSKRNLFLDIAKVGLSRKAIGPISQSCQIPPKLSALPLLTTWEEDGGPFVTLPLVHTEHPVTGVPNLGMYRIQRYDDVATGFHTQIGKGAGFHLHAAKQLGKKLPVNISIGGPPALILSAIAPLPENVPELMLASLVLGKRLPLAANDHGPLPLIANAEFVLVGEVDPNEIRAEGPFGDHYGYYSLKHDYPVFRCKAMYARKDAICTATVVGKPRQEDFFLGDYLQKLLSPLFPVVMPSVRDLWSYGETGYHSLAAAVVQERYRREAMVSAFRILGEGQLSLTKFLLVLNKDLDLKNFKGVLEHVLERADFRTDLFIFSNISMDTLDYTGPKVNEGSKGVLLGLGEPIRKLPGAFSGSLPTGVTKAIPYCRGCLVLQGKDFSSEKELAQQVAKHEQLSEWPLVILTDDAAKATRTEMDFLWTTFTRFEPASDLKARSTTIERNHIAFQGPLIIDARMKPWYPKELECDEKTKAMVSKRWNDYGII